ncbi:acetate--CoA ligase family protein [Anaerosoma tenue]|uniref:acetate--CoA ligase family protein n=1 Tax=Anaerosoma tenue TaxID=2933588 RepID=UPI0022609A4F|nr:acetate--CoA ligase [Anaerosoma tenue]MCK8114182.1 acetate--CoA ligase family protein [Anaerosoma tenue]
MPGGLFAPRGIAVVGASRDPSKVGGAVLANIVSGGYGGAIYPVNPNATEIGGYAAYGSVADVPDPVDMAVIVVPARGAVDAVRQCAGRGIGSAVVISAGFRETGAAGAVIERELVAAARDGGVRILGPNCLGLIATRSSLNASFAPIMPAPGGISFLSQSGALGTAILDWARGEGIGLAHFVSLGNKADISEVDLIRMWSHDPDTRVVVAYLEAISHGRAFVDSVIGLRSHAPFIALTAGSSDAGAKAVSSHTGSLAGSRVAYEAAFRKAGAVPARTVQELFDLAEGFSRQPLPAGPGTVILTNAGGPAILATDACAAEGLTLASLEPSTVSALREVLPDAAAVYNPVDILGDAPASRFDAAARILVEDPGVRSLIVVLTPQAMTEALETAQTVASVAADSSVTTLAVFMGDQTVAEANTYLREHDVPTYAFPERAVATLAAMQRHALRIARPEAPVRHVEAETRVVREAIDHAREAGRTFITESSAARIAGAYGIRVPASGLAHDLSEARSLAASIGFPVVMKIASPDVLHKSDIGGIVFDIDSVDAVEDAYDSIMRKVMHRLPEATIWGVTLQEQLPPGREVIIGVNRDASFGPILMFGLGGIYVEVLKDVSFRMCPVTPDDAREMVDEIRSNALLRGARGEAPADIEAIVDVICRVSALAMEFEDITELDINPLIVGMRSTGAVAADIRIGIGG